MKVGTKSVLFGAHCWFLHPWFVALAWCKLYGFPRDWRLWLCFFVHDLGYWGKPNMDGPEGESHVEWGARFVRRVVRRFSREQNVWEWCKEGRCWHDFCLYHSRFYAKRDGAPHSRLCVADKLAVALEPWWLYLPRAIASGEIREYMAKADAGKYQSMNIGTVSRRRWFADVTDYLRRWVDEHKDGRTDTWTPSTPAQEAPPPMLMASPPFYHGGQLRTARRYRRRLSRCPRCRARVGLCPFRATSGLYVHRACPCGWQWLEGVG